MHGPYGQQRRNNEQEIEKTPFLVVQKIRDAILDETFKPGERLLETRLGAGRLEPRRVCFLLIEQSVIADEK
jgi:hypothetical protein